MVLDGLLVQTGFSAKHSRSYLKMRLIRMAGALEEGV
jgi:hypothetical protein